MAMCLLCLERCSPAQGVCDSCLVNLPTLKNCCEKCREPLHQADEAPLCKRCQTTPRKFENCISPLVYKFPVSTMVQKLKYSRRLIYERPLTAHLINELEDHYSDTPWPEALIPVPLHWWKLRKRGFNQADVIASRLSKLTGVPMLHRHVKRVSYGTPQQGLSAEQRQKNMKGAFAVKKPIPFTHVAVIDDVMTTGATIEELSRVLKQYGVQAVDVWCLARTPAF